MLSLNIHVGVQVSADPLENLVRQAMYDYNLPQPKAAVWLPEGPKIDHSLMVSLHVLRRNLPDLLGYITSCLDHLLKDGYLLLSLQFAMPAVQVLTVACTLEIPCTPECVRGPLTLMHAGCWMLCLAHAATYLTCCFAVVHVAELRGCY